MGPTGAGGGGVDTKAVAGVQGGVDDRRRGACGGAPGGECDDRAIGAGDGEGYGGLRNRHVRIKGDAAFDGEDDGNDNRGVGCAIK